MASVGTGTLEKNYQNDKTESVYGIRPEEGTNTPNFNDNRKKPASLCENCSEHEVEVTLRPHPKRVVSINTPTTPRAYLRKTNSSSDLRKTHSTSDLLKYSGISQSPKLRKDGNMVLQLVVPASSVGNRNSNYDNYLTTHSLDYSNNSGDLKDLNRFHSYSRQDSRQSFQPSPDLSGTLINHGFGPDYSSRSPVALSNPSPPGLGKFGLDNPTPNEVKKKAFSDLLTKTSSLFYALFNVTLGLALYVSDIVDGSHVASEVFSLVMVGVAFLYILYLTIDISLFKKRRNKYDKQMESQLENIEVEKTPEGHFQFNVIIPSGVKTSVPHDYCFNKDRHSTNFFLKVGASAFCFGHLVHSGMLLGYQVMFLTHDDHKFYECASIPTLILDISYPVYSFFLLFFIFKYSNVIINKNKVIARYGIIHCLSASLCFWIWTIFREILEAIASKKYKQEEETFVGHPQVLAQHSYNQKGAVVLAEMTEYVNATLRRFTEICDYGDDNITAVYRDISPYLYPFSVEFSILIVGNWFLIWQNIGICKAGENEQESTTAQCNNPWTDQDNTESNVTIHVDCHSSNKGLFAGFFVLILTIISSILFFISVLFGDDGGSNGSLLYISTSLFILSLMTIACIAGYRRISILDLNSAHHNMLDDFLLFICIPAYFLNGIFSIIPAIIYADTLGTINIVLEVFQVLLQTGFILDGVRRSSNTRQLRKDKPGRETVTFLVIANIALWLLQTLAVKSNEVQDNRYEFFGKELWTILGHLCLPLMMFYRFHSAVCFGDIWKYAYEPSGH